MADGSLVADGYRIGRTLTAAHGRTYFGASLLLGSTRRRGVYALYGFARTADDLVDDGPVDDAAAALDLLGDGLTAARRGQRDPRLDHRSAAVVAALADTVDRFAIDPRTFDAFLRSMRADIPGTAEFRSRYRTFDELAGYTYGSAAVIGVQMLPLLGLPDPSAEVTGAAVALGEAFQLTNFLRDVAEDLDRDRIYLPTDELAVFGVDEDHLRDCRRDGRTSPELRRALAHLIAVNRDLYRRASVGVDALPATSRPAIAAAAVTYHDILVEIETSGYAVMRTRAVVPNRRRVAHALRAVAGIGSGGL